MRNKVLKALLDNKDSFISGERISSSLGITRAAIWKHIKTLQHEGFVIDTKPRLGYRLVKIPDILDETILLESIDTGTMGRNIEVHDTINSTNNRARELALAGAPEGTLIIAETQTVGRGRLGRNWISPKGRGVWMSLILRPDIPPEKAPGITTVIAVAIRRALNQLTGLDFGIKWPNDIIMDGKKVCGILTEMHGDMDRIYYVAVGIGINVNLGKSDLPAELIQTATSLNVGMGENMDRRSIIARAMKEIEDTYSRYIEDGDFDAILKECKMHSLTLNRSVTVIGRDGEFEGYAIDFDADGSLLVKMQDGRVRKVISGDVSVRGRDGYV
ncbi:MAG TPA: biotin--[acetyl-CoA-carboxylase] ligase [Clostridia bacterium]|nr:biotin--[acetyl-CoA-carboxylase] ligase [Clostridia bacterium]